MDKFEPKLQDSHQNLYNAKLRLQPGRDHEGLWQPVEDFCSVSKFSGFDNRNPTLSLKAGRIIWADLDPQDYIREYLEGFSVNSSAPSEVFDTDVSEEIKEKIIGFHVRDAFELDPKHLEKTGERMIKDIQMCDRLGIQFYNFHPGIMTAELSVEKFIQKVGETINFVHEHTQESSVVLLIETAAGQGCEVGSKFEHLKDMMELVKDKQRIGVCLDTCHVFAAGYDISCPVGYERTMVEFDRIIGMGNLKAIHLNDSKGRFCCKQDRHQLIGQGHIGLDAFRLIMNDSRLNGVPMVLETPKQKDDHLTEIQLLHSFEGCKSYFEEIQKLSTDEFSDELNEYYRKNAQDEPAFQAKDAIRLELEGPIKKEFGEEARLYGIGGFTNGIGKRNSDLDLCLFVPPSACTIQNSSAWQFSMDILRRAQEAIGRSCAELRKSSMNSVIKSAYRFPTLALILKNWANAAGINNAKEGFLNNYTLILLTLHYLQAGCQPAVLPNIQALYPDVFVMKEDNQDPGKAILKFNEKLDVIDKSTNRIRVGKLLMGLFSYYCQFDFENKWISIKAGSAIDRSVLLAGETSKSLVYVQDPFQEKNTARCVLEKEKLEKIRNAFRNAFGNCQKRLGLKHLGLQ